jgi:hypothetical protein
MKTSDMDEQVFLKNLPLNNVHLLQLPAVTKLVVGTRLQR